MNITEFLLARIIEDEAECTPMAAMDDDDRGGWAIAYAERVLAECAAKRAILADHDEEMTHWWPEMVEVQVCARCGDGVSVEWPCPTIAALAAVYKDHPDYQQSWATD